MLLTLIPLFDEKMAVSAYSIFSQKDNFLLNPLMEGTRKFDGATSVPELEVIQNMGIETISDEKEIFVPLSNISIFTDIAEQCDAPHERIALLVDNTVPPMDMYINRLKELKEQGYKLAIRKLPVSEFENYKQILGLMDYLFLNNKKIDIEKAKIFFGKLYPNIKLCAGNIDTNEIYETLIKSGGYAFYEGSFYRVPITKGEKEVAPLKVNYISLLNTVNNDNFDLAEAADIIGQDTALTISLMQMVNRMSVNGGITSIRHATAMLGQKELKKWINTAVVNELYSDKPSEITRVSLLRAKFAESLAPAFGLAMKSDELFLMGLFSVLDVILERDMSEALKMLQVEGDIAKALTEHTGKYAPVLEFVTCYEIADWQEVCRQMILQQIELDTVYQAYLDSLKWYRTLMKGDGQGE
ncbi:MAG: HDOD domain-containing protein [Lachnoclostridium sp.]|nr:HDOD domain-containing protein [Lachnospira sp.]MCM1247557.1 HDOD domain-containing protein [Lachnoclostridium sp.]